MPRGAFIFISSPIATAATRSSSNSTRNMPKWRGGGSGATRRSSPRSAGEGRGKKAMKREPLLKLYDDELIVDSFAGGGGASLGIEWALGRSPDIAINHDREAIQMHRANHPGTKHYVEDVWKVDPKKACAGRPVGLMWLSPDCKHFSKAKGGKAGEKKNRGLGWMGGRWAKKVRPRVICLENVEEFIKWGPLLADGTPCKARIGQTYRRFVRKLETLGYQVEARELVAADYGVPTSRRRLFLVARCDGAPIMWPKATHGKGRAPYRTAAECISWEIPCPSIFERTRELAANTQRRIARGIRKYVIDSPEPFIVPVAHAGDARAHSIDEPMRTITGAHRGEHALVQPFTVRTDMHKSNAGRAYPMSDPLRTITTGGGHALVSPVVVAIDNQSSKTGAAWAGDAPLTTVTVENRHAIVAPSLVRVAHGERDKNGKKRGQGEHECGAPLPTVTASNDFALMGATLIQTGYGERPGQVPRVPGLHKPLGTCVDGQKHALVAAFMAQHNTGEVGHPMTRPLSTIVQKGCTQGLVAAHITQYNGMTTESPRGGSLEEPLRTVTADPRHGLVAATITKHFSGEADRSHRPDKPLGAVVANGAHHSLVASSLIKLRGTCRDGQALDKPLGTASTQGNHFAEVPAFLIDYHRDGGQ